jgi:uncharacterized protein YutE (UPF0331/DUF86 family)
MNAKQLQRSADELSARLNEFQQIGTEIAGARSRLGTGEPTTFDLYAVAGILHDVYQGVENICNYIAKEIDKQVPVSATSHRDLLEQMTRPSPQARPAVIQPETAKLLDEYRKFRHVARHTYGFKFDWSRVKPLLTDVDEAIRAFVADIEQFVAWLRMMASDN